MSNSVNDPVYMLATFADKAVPMAGLKVTLADFAGRTRSQTQPIQMLSDADERRAPDIKSAENLSDVLAHWLEGIAKSALPPLDAEIVRTWLAGQNEQDAADELRVSVQAIHSARARILRSIRVSIDPQPT